ncbi:hypothetical protein SKAU_G00135460 [Synaphobranchus kaupii]|uniref:Uncharacterized protein n=1 Tax=Synaphobranchus kaupii TaxID=118154 RepID=A0A9Q1J3X0_SYNKA|nr:hypothetical protein SKAU_G00135460 [Synaphobranchus kaupii]
MPALSPQIAEGRRCFCSGQSWTLCSCSCTCSSPPHDSRQGGPALVHREELKQDQASQSPSLRKWHKWQRSPQTCSGTAYAMV